MIGSEQVLPGIGSPGGTARPEHHADGVAVYNRTNLDYHGHSANHRTYSNNHTPLPGSTIRLSVQQEVMEAVVCTLTETGAVWYNLSLETDLGRQTHTGR